MMANKSDQQLLDSYLSQAGIKVAGAGNRVPKNLDALKIASACENAAFNLIGDDPAKRQVLSNYINKAAAGDPPVSQTNPSGPGPKIPEGKKTGPKPLEETKSGPEPRGKASGELGKAAGADLWESILKVADPPVKDSTQPVPVPSGPMSAQVQANVSSNEAARKNGDSAILGARAKAAAQFFMHSSTQPPDLFNHKQAAAHEKEEKKEKEEKEEKEEKGKKVPAADVKKIASYLIGTKKK